MRTQCYLLEGNLQRRISNNLAEILHRVNIKDYMSHLYSLGLRKNETNNK